MVEVWCHNKLGAPHTWLAASWRPLAHMGGPDRWLPGSKFVTLFSMSFTVNSANPANLQRNSVNNQTFKTNFILFKCFNVCLNATNQNCYNIADTQNL